MLSTDRRCPVRNNVSHSWQTDDGAEQNWQIECIILAQSCSKWYIYGHEEPNTIRWPIADSRAHFYQWYSEWYHPPPITPHPSFVSLVHQFPTWIMERVNRSFHRCNRRNLFPQQTVQSDESQSGLFISLPQKLEWIINVDSAMGLNHCVLTKL